MTSEGSASANKNRRSSLNKHTIVTRQEAHLLTGVLYDTGRKIMDNVEFYHDAPTNLTTMVVGFGGWIDAGEAATGSIRYMVRRLSATRLATIDPETFFVFTDVRPSARRTAEGNRIIRWPRSDFYMWHPPEGGEGLLLFRGMEPSLKWRTYTKLLLDIAEQCGRA